METESKFIEPRKEAGIPPPEIKIFTSNQGYEVREVGSQWLMTASSPIFLQVEFEVTQDGPREVREEGRGNYQESLAYPRLKTNMKNDALFEFNSRKIAAEKAAEQKQKPLF